MKLWHQPLCLWRQREWPLLVLAAGLLLAVWAPVPAPWQLAFRLALLYIMMVGWLWIDAVRTFDCDDPHLSARCRERLRSFDQHHTLWVPLHRRQRHHLASAGKPRERQTEGGAP
jgi:hypothetical protein